MLHPTLSPAAVADALRKNVDPQKWTLFSLSGYQGVPIVGEITEKGFRLQRRRVWRTDFAPNLNGQITPESEGSRIEVHFDHSRSTKMFMKVWLVDVTFMTGDAGTGIVVFPALIL